MCVSKMLSMNNTGKDLKETTVAASQFGKGYKLMSNQCEVPRSTVRKIIHKCKNNVNTVASLTRSGHPSKFTSRSDHVDSTGFS